MIEPLRAYWSDIGEPALCLVGHRQSSEEGFAAPLGVLACGEHCSQVVAGMAGLVAGKIAVVVIQVAHQRAVIKRRPVRSGLPATDQRHQGVAPEVFELEAEHADGWPFDGPDGAAQGVEHVDFQLLAHFCREAFIGGSRDERRKLFNPGHTCLPLWLLACFQCPQRV